MQVSDLPGAAIDTPDWNPNRMDQAMRARLRESFERFGDIGVTVVRQTGENRYETIGGAQKLGVLRDLEVESASCVIVEADRLLDGSDGTGFGTSELLHTLDKLIDELEAMQRVHHSEHPVPPEPGERGAQLGLEHHQGSDGAILKGSL